MLGAEQSVIGCLMLEPALLDKARTMLSPKMFEAEPLARIFSCMLKLKKAGMPVDAVTVVSKLGAEYDGIIRECASITPRIGTFPQYAAIVLDAWRERTLVTDLQSLAISGHTADEMTAELERIAAQQRDCALPGFVDSKNEEKTERNAGYLVVSQSGGGMLRQGTREGIRRTPANRGMRAHWVVKGLDISEDVCHGMCP